MVGCQNRIKMTELYQCKVGAKVASWPILGWKLAILAIFHVLPIICINIWRQTPLEINWTQIAIFILLKPPKMSISQNSILAKCQSPKSLLLLHYSMSLFETFRINVNVDFANNIRKRIFKLGPQKHFGPKIFKKKRFWKFFRFWTQNCLKA